MSASGSRTWVLVAAGLMFAAVFVRKDRITDPFRYAWAAGVITLFLSVLADLAPEIAGPAAILILMAVYWRNRGTLQVLSPASPGKGAATAPATTSGGAQ